ncbi:MAG: SprT family zinc-dependent metalloprotease [Pseudobdellovibrionaceae bacterium]
MLDFSTLNPDLVVKISSRARRLALRLDTQARKVNLIVPHRASMGKAYEFASANQNWIREKLGTLPRPIPFAHGAIIPIMGTPRTICLDKSGGKITTITIQSDSIHIASRSGDIAPRLTRHLKTIASEEFYSIALEKAARLNKPITQFTIRDMKTRWGSCSTDGKMTLSWRLIFAPPEAIDYVIAHEAAHLIHPNHSPRFWKLCENLCTDFKAGSAWMREHGASLAQYGASL